MDYRDRDYGSREPRDTRVPGSWSDPGNDSAAPPAQWRPPAADPPPWGSVSETGSLQPAADAVVWARRADAWAQRVEPDPSMERENRWSDAANSSAPVFPPDGVGWRAMTAEWRSTTETANWRATTEWRFTSGTAWRSTVEATGWQADGGRDWRPEPEPPTRQPAISGTAWPTAGSEPPPERPTALQDWRQPAPGGPALSGPALGGPAPDRAAEWTPRPDTPGVSAGPAAAGPDRRPGRDDDRAGWSGSGRRGGTAADNWAGHADTSDLPLYPDRPAGWSEPDRPAGWSSPDPPAWYDATGAAARADTPDPSAWSAGPSAGSRNPDLPARSAGPADPAWSSTPDGVPGSAGPSWSAGPAWPREPEGPGWSPGSAPGALSPQAGRLPDTGHRGGERDLPAWPGASDAAAWREKPDGGTWQTGTDGTNRASPAPSAEPWQRHQAAEPWQRRETTEPWQRDPEPPSAWRSETDTAAWRTDPDTGSWGRFADIDPDRTQEWRRDEVQPRPAPDGRDARSPWAAVPEQRRPQHSRSDDWDRLPPPTGTAGRGYGDDTPTIGWSRGAGWEDYPPRGPERDDFPPRATARDYYPPPPVAPDRHPRRRPQVEDYSDREVEDIPGQARRGGYGPRPADGLGQVGEPAGWDRSRGPAPRDGDADPVGWARDVGPAYRQGPPADDWRRELAASNGRGAADTGHAFPRHEPANRRSDGPRAVGSASVRPAGPAPRDGAAPRDGDGFGPDDDREWLDGRRSRENLLVAAGGRGSWMDAPTTQWPPRDTGGQTATYERRPVGGLAVSARQPLLEEVDDDELPGGPLAAVLYTLVWYGVPVVLFVAYMFVLDRNQQDRALNTLVAAVPQFGISLVLSVAVAVGLRWISGTWKSASVGLAAAVVGGGLATVLISVINDQSLS